MDRGLRDVRLSMNLAQTLSQLSVLCYSLQKQPAKLIWSPHRAPNYYTYLKQLTEIIIYSPSCIFKPLRKKGYNE